MSDRCDCVAKYDGVVVIESIKIQIFEMDSLGNSVTRELTDDFELSKVHRRS